jgi:hypothetical protein
MSDRLYAVRRLARARDQLPSRALDRNPDIRDGAWVADITGLLDLSSWPHGMRVIIRKERPHPGA